MGAITIKQALESLDPENDAQWTHDGLPRMDVVEKLVDDKAITRKDVTEADPEFCRDTAKVRNVAEAEKAKENENDIHPEVQAGDKEKTKAPQISPEEQLRADILVIDEAINDATADRTAIDKTITKMHAQRDALQNKCHRTHTPAADTKARMDFIESQNKARAARFAKGQMILKIVGKDGLNPKCKLDQAMMRKTARGTKRPPPRTPSQ